MHTAYVLFVFFDVTYKLSIKVVGLVEFASQMVSRDDLKLAQIYGSLHCGTR